MLSSFRGRAAVHREPANGADRERTYYRIVGSADVSEDDFKPAKDLGKPLLDPELARPWAEEVSVYDTFERSANRVRRYRYKLGRFVIAVTLPAGADIEVEQSGNDPRHYTLYDDPRQILSFVNDLPVPVDEEEGL